jgi:replicative DNA helicase|tara:strand:+ start:2046 stop:3443 length:1398 start_codon:yes stop_codon:yes gene_type:complete
VSYDESSVSFGSYGKSFQEKIVQGLLTDRLWAEQMSEVINVDFFDLKYLKFLADRYFKYHGKYKDFPTLQLLVSIIRDDLKTGNDTVLRDQIIEYLQRIRHNPDMGDLEYVKEKALDFCKKQAFRGALEQAVDLIQTDKFDSVMDLMRTALSVGTTPSIGHDLFEDMEARFVTVSRHPVPTGMEALDQKGILNGGLGRGEIGVVAAPTGVGKSHMLVNLGAAAVKRGKNVIHYTFELTENGTGLRYDSNLCMIPSNEITERSDEVRDAYAEMEGLGRLIIKEYPTGAATVQTLRSHIEKLSLKGFIPDLLVIDYADIMRSSRQYDSMRHELKKVYEDLRNLAMEKQIPIWTASQSNRESASSDIVGLENMSESYGKAQVADVVISISRKPTEKASGLGRIFIAKNRAGRDGILFPVKLNTAMSMFSIIENSEEMTLSEAQGKNENDIKKVLQQKWKQVSKRENNS